MEEKRHRDVITEDKFREILTDVFSEHLTCHRQHHDWIQARILAEENRSKMYQDLATSVIQWGVVGIMGGIVTWLYTHIKF